ncbi:histone deacetylase 7 isoform X1 [Triplophysa rosa]|nr:histone deacetylase 7 isoform X1 [Triplophysa rosa]
MEMSQHQHGRLERGRESKPLNKKKSEQGAIASPWVKQRLQQFILNRQDQVAAPDIVLSAFPRKPKLDLNQSESLSNTYYSDCFGEDNPLRRTVSEPILKVRRKRSLTGRQNPLQRKTSAPPAVRAPDTMGVAPSSSSVPKRSLAADKETQNYGPPQSHEAEPPPHIALQNPIFLSVMPQSWPAPQMQLSPVPPNCLTVTEPPGMSHRTLYKTKSAPSYISYTYTETIAVTHPIYDQHHTFCLQDRVQHHTVPHKVPFHKMWHSCSEELYDKERPLGSESYRERAKDGGHNQFESTDKSYYNQMRPEAEEYNHRPIRWPHRHLNKSLPPRLRCPTTVSNLSQSIMNKPNYTTGLVYDSQILKHECDCGDNSKHPEHAGRIKSIWSRLHECGLQKQCELVRGRMATFEELQSVHSKDHVILFTEHSDHIEMFQTQPCGGKGRHHDMVWNSLSSSAALKMAVGSVIELALRVALGELRNGFALVRPPGLHAAQSQTGGFSIFNSVAIAAKQLQHRLNMKKILIVDWDIHHGCGTEAIFYTDPSVLYISLHRYDYGTFFPGTGGPKLAGDGEGKGYNVNVAWSGGLDPPMGDAEYLAAFRTIVMPIAREFSPNVVLVSAGFDAADGHSPALGGYKVSAKCFGFLTRKLMELAEGRVVLVLEGGFDLTTLCDASQACVGALLGNEPEPLAEEELLRRPCDNAVRSLEELLRVQSQYWGSVRSVLESVALPYVKAERRYSADSDAASAMGGLTMTVPSRRCYPNEPMEHDEADSMTEVVDCSVVGDRRQS